MNYRNFLKTGLLIFSILFFAACSKDGDDEATPAGETYSTTVEVTDAPIDNANVQGAFVTVTNVKINGKALEGFNTTTVDLLALQNGKTQTLGNIALESGTTASIVVQLSNDADDKGEAMANYILLTSGEKKELVLESTEIVLTDAAEVVADANNSVVLDFDLRKMIVTDAETNEFRFVSNAEMQNSIRAVNRVNAGKIAGKVEDSNNAAESIVVYAYKKGTYSEAEATKESNGVRFAGAVNSALVSEADGSYSLDFLEEGEYELRYAAYSENTAGEMQFQGVLQAKAALGLDLSLLGLKVGAKNTTQADVVITGIVQ